MNKNISLILFALIIALTGCKGNKNTQTQQAPTPTPVAPAPTPVEPQPLVTETGGAEAKNEPNLFHNVMCPDIKYCQCEDKIDEEGSTATKCTFENAKLSDIYPRLYNYNEGFNNPEDKKLLLPELPQASKTVQHSSKDSNAPESSTSYIMDGNSVKIEILLPGGKVNYLLQQQEGHKVLFEAYHELP